MTTKWRRRQVLEIVFGLAPATFFLLPFLLIGAFGMVMAEIAGGTMDWALAGQIFWALAGVAGVAALWVVVLGNGSARLAGNSRLAITAGLLLGILSAVRWLWWASTSGHRYDAATWAVWLALLAGPLLVASTRLTQLWSPSR